MAVIKNDPFPGTDYSSYKSWNTVTTPDGGVYYEVPGRPEYVYDEVSSDATGRKVFRRNPKQQITAQQEENERIQKAQEQQAFNQSPAGQLMPVAAGTAGLIAANQFMPASATDLATAQLVKQSAGNATAQAAAQGATQQGLSAPGVISAGRVPVEGAIAPSSGGIGSYFGSGGSLFNTEGMLGEAGSFAPGNILGAVGGGYGMYKASQMSNKKSGIATGAASGALAGSSIAPGWGTAIGAVLGGLAGAAAHESTADRTTRRYGELSGDANFQSMANQGMQESLAGVDTWDIGDDKGSAPIDMMTRSYGVLKTFGPEWTNISQDKRKEITQKLVDNDLLNSKQGEYLIDNPQKAKEIMQATLNPQTPAQAAASGALRPKATTVR
jgi:hypothetical protein